MTDVGGNTSEPDSITVTIDNAAPILHYARAVPIVVNLDDPDPSARVTTLSVSVTEANLDPLTGIGDVLAFEWTLIAAPDGSAVTGETLAGGESVEVMLDAEGTYQFACTVSDGAVAATAVATVYAGTRSDGSIAVTVE